MIGEMGIVLYQAAVVAGAIIGFAGIGYRLRRQHRRFSLMVAAAILPGVALTVAPAAVALFWAAAVAGGVVALIMARVDGDGTGARGRVGAAAL